MESGFENPYEEKCPILYAMSIIGAKWKIPILWHLAHCESLRYNELKRHLNGITNTVLTRCLQELEQDEVIIRRTDGSVPPSVTYELSALGKELIPALDGLFEWGSNHRNGIAPADQDCRSRPSARIGRTHRSVVTVTSGPDR